MIGAQVHRRREALARGAGGCFPTILRNRSARHAVAYNLSSHTMNTEIIPADNQVSLCGSEEAKWTHCLSLQLGTGDRETLCAPARTGESDCVAKYRAARRLW